jgi:putative methyltransferase (TIGR04325 family)
MSMVQSLASVRGTVKRIPAVRAWLHARLYEHFLSARGFTSYYGVYEGFEEARRHLPASREFDSREVIAGLMNERLYRIYPYDYPVVYWLREAFLGGVTSVYDIGGSVGVHFYAYRRILRYPERLRWLVCEVPAAAAMGRHLAGELGAEELEFVDRLDASEVGAQAWISAGALQYIEDGDLGRLLASCPQPPRFLILNKLPVYDGPAFVVAQNIGPGVYAPSWVYNRARFVAGIEAQGYELVDTWRVPEREFYLPGHPERSFGAFTGFCFGRAAAA